METHAAHPNAEQARQTAVALLRERYGKRAATGEAIRQQHTNTLTWIANEPPDAVVWPLTTEEVVDIVRLAAEHRVPVIAFGAGTSLEGHVNAPAGGIALDMGRMNTILAVRPRDLDCTVEAGVTRRQLNEHLRDQGLFFAVDPGAEEATLGGMAATRASGTTAVRYGTMRENVLNVTAVMADGSIVRTGGRARKSAAGYDLTRLLVGSEGTIGIITDVTLRLYGVPETVVSAVCPFATTQGACNASIQAIGLGLGVARIELLDGVQIGAVNAYSKLQLQETPTLFVEFHGTEAATKEQVCTFEEIAREEGALEFSWAADGPLHLDLEGYGIRDLYYAGNDQLFILSGLIGSNPTGQHPSGKLWRLNTQSSELRLVFEIPQVPDKLGNDFEWSAAEGVCSIKLDGEERMLVVYDSLESGIFQILDFPSQ